MEPTTNHASNPPERLQKVLASAGYGSRRECEALIEEGRVEVQRQVVTQLGTKVDLATQEVRVDGVAIKKPRLVYYLLNKPVNVVCTNSDPEGRPRVIDLVKSDQRIFPVGRLDRTSEGLILVTNDGELANQLTHPRYGVEKTYHAVVDGFPNLDDLKMLERGVHLAEGFAQVASARVKKKFKGKSELEIVLREGRNREVRRLLARIGHKVRRLVRVAIGPVKLAGLPTGAYRVLERSELAALRKASRPSGAKKASRKKTPKQQVAKNLGAARSAQRGTKKKSSKRGGPVEKQASRKPSIKGKRKGKR